MKNRKTLGIILMLVLAVALHGCNLSGGNKTRPAPNRPRSQMNRPGGKPARPWSQPQFPGVRQGSGERKK